MIILNTDVVSEAMRPSPEPTVLQWIAVQQLESLFVTTITQAEMLCRVQCLPIGGRRERLAVAMHGLFEEDFFGRLLPFDSAAAQAYAVIVAERQSAGRPISQFDAQIAAIAKVKDYAVATTNISGVSDCGVDFIYPWAM